MPPDEITISIARSPGETAQNNDARQTQRPLEIGTSVLGQVLQNMRWIDPAPLNEAS